MVRTLLFLFAAIAAASGDEDPWTKVRKMESGSDVRVYRSGKKKPVEGKFEQASAESVVVLLKNAQVSIPREQVERVDWRPARNGGGVAMETGRHVGTREAAATGRSKDSNLPPRSTVTGIKIRPWVSYETIYRRAEAPPKK